jgi:hypothetical protein
MFIYIDVRKQGGISGAGVLEWTSFYEQQEQID